MRKHILAGVSALTLLIGQAALAQGLPQADDEDNRNEAGNIETNTLVEDPGAVPGRATLHDFLAGEAPTPGAETPFIAGHFIDDDDYSFSAFRLVGQTVADSEGNEWGTISDVLFNRSGQVSHVIVTDEDNGEMVA